MTTSPLLLALYEGRADDVERLRAESGELDLFEASALGDTERLRELPPEEFMEMLYSAVEQDAWLLYVHGGVLGLFVGLSHLAIFGA